MRVLKKDENQMIDIIKERIQEEFVKMYGFAPSKKDIRPMEYGAEIYCETWIITDMAFCVGSKGWCYTKQGNVERNDAYDI